MDFAFRGLTVCQIYWPNTSTRDFGLSKFAPVHSATNHNGTLMWFIRVMLCPTYSHKAFVEDVTSYGGFSFCDGSATA